MFHLAHQMLTLFALGATPADLLARYDQTAAYQPAPPPVDGQTVHELGDSVKFIEKLSNITYYSNCLTFVQTKDRREWRRGCGERFCFQRRRNGRYHAC